jgi:hypothetical protein
VAGNRGPMSRVEIGMLHQPQLVKRQRVTRASLHQTP